MYSLIDMIHSQGSLLFEFYDDFASILVAFHNGVSFYEAVGGAPVAGQHLADHWVYFFR